MVKPASGRSKDELMQAFGACLQRGDIMGALEPGIEIVEQFGASNVEPGLVATLPSLLMQRRAPGDAERACALCAPARCARRSCPISRPPCATAATR